MGVSGGLISWTVTTIIMVFKWVSIKRTFRRFRQIIYRKATLYRIDDIVSYLIAIKLIFPNINIYNFLCIFLGNERNETKKFD